MKVFTKLLFIPLLLAVVMATGCSNTNASAGDTTAPFVISKNPVNLSTTMYTNSSITATFSEAMDPATINETTFTLVGPGGAVAGAVTYSGVIAVFNPEANLANNTAYTATIFADAEDLEGNPLVPLDLLAANEVWTFTTGANVDVSAPTVSSTSPLNAALDVPINSYIDATFSEAMDPATITDETFTLKRTDTSAVVAGTVTYVGSVGSFKASSNLAVSTEYTATITTEVKDLAGNTLALAETWNFTTGTAIAEGPRPVNLGLAGQFVMLAKTSISTTNSVANSIIGNIGVSPAAASFITGFGLIAPPTTSTTSALVDGLVYAADYDPPTPAYMTASIGDMEVAYTDAAGRTDPTATELGAGNISGMTLAPGLYKWGTGVLISTGGVTLSGDSRAVWIFQIAQGLTVANGAIITLSGGAEPKNVFWQVAGQTTLGTTSQFKGIILCKTLIQMQTGTALTGRALAQTAVTLDAGTVTAP